ncbi:MAG: serine/threonine protein kinase [Opitutales bacterium]|nr:serine/threonine protein kinase [Opitutales bacterium]
MTHCRNLESSIHYQLLEKIAEGGMGEVYRARQLGVDNFSKLVAIKIIREEYSSIPEFRANFVGEARVVADLIHTNIVQTYHLGIFDNQYFMVMEYVDGFTLDEFIYQHQFLGRQIPVEIAAFIISRICRGLDYAHNKSNSNGKPLGIVHRDINPRNIMICREGNIKLSDFGIAKAFDLMYNEEGEVIPGMDEYISPEAANREITDPRSDLFSCGVVLLEMVLGYNFFEGDTPEESRENILKKPYVDFRSIRDDLDEDLYTIIRALLQRERKWRFQSAKDLLMELEKYLYRDRFGPTNEKLSDYMIELFINGSAFPRESEQRGSFGIPITSHDNLKEMIS